MTKQEYLKSIGYELNDFLVFCSMSMFEKIYEEFDSDFIKMCIELDRNIYFVQIPSARIIESQKDIDSLQIAFNNVKHDFEEMQKYED